MVKYPSMRDEVIETLKDLSDIEYQREAWANQIFPEGVEFDCFDNSVRLLLEELSLVKAPEGVVGVVLENQEELDAVRQVAVAIDNVLNVYGTKLSDAEYIATPEWSNVLSTAVKALTVLEKPD